MAFDKKTRNELGKMVAECRRLLTDDVRDQFQRVYGIQPDGSSLDINKLKLDDRGREIAVSLRQWLDHLAAGETGTEQERRKAAFDRIANETAFTYVNRLAALRMCEERELVIECVRKGLTSDGFQLYERMAGQGLGDRGQTYRIFLECLFDELAVDLGVLFDRQAVHSLVFPSADCIEKVLEQLNRDDFKLLWKLDETIGWVYQYFNDEQERRQMRDDAPAPRNTRELAIRNQFFTPRYVVEFLTDNTLGRIWFEMRHGDTQLANDCQFLVRYQSEVFLGATDSPPDATASNQDTATGTRYIRHRSPKDPRDFKVLDPACGSGHFLLYAFDLLEVMYREAWRDADWPAFETSAKSLHDEYSSEQQLLKAVPELIIRHNLHGIDVDPRACQIAGLALWLRAQRSYLKLGVKAADRPTIKKSNIVAAEPMPGEDDLRVEFLATLKPPLLADLVDRVFEKMKLVGEAGSLLKIDEEISEAVTTSREKWAQQLARAKDRKGNDLLFSVAEVDAATNASQKQLNFTDISDAQFWDKAESQIVNALQGFTEQASDGAAWRRGLFNEDAKQGFAFIDVCRNRYDVILMNPPFGESPSSCGEMFGDSFPLTCNDLYSMFYERTLQWLTVGGKVGAITNRTWLGLPTFENLRRNVFCRLGTVEVAADLGSFVLEAQVETAAIVAAKDATADTGALWIRLIATRRKEELLQNAVDSLRQGSLDPSAFISCARRFLNMPKAVYGYWMSDMLITLYESTRSIDSRAAKAVVGLQTSDDFRFLRLVWEVPSHELGMSRCWAWLGKGGEYSPFFDDIHLAVKWSGDGDEIRAFSKSYIRNPGYYGRAGITWPRRTTSPFGPRVFPEGCIFGDKGPIAVPKGNVSAQLLLGLLTTRPSRLLLSVRLGAGDNAPGSASKSYEVGLIGALPYPDLTPEKAGRIAELTLRAVDVVRCNQFDVDETTTGFVVPLAIRYRAGTLREAVEAAASEREDRLIQWANVEDELDQIVAEAFGFTATDYRIMGEELEVPLNQHRSNEPIDEAVFRQAYLTKDLLPGTLLPGGEEAAVDVRVESRRKKQQTLRNEATLCRLFDISPERFANLRRSHGLIRDEDLKEAAAGLISYLVGVAFGRWDVRFAVGSLRRPVLPDAFASLRPCPLGLLVGNDGLPSSVPPSEYPVEIAPDGILVDDPGLDGLRKNASDIVEEVRRSVQLIWPEQADAIEQEICMILGVADLRAYFRVPTHFFDFHQSRYGKSRRKAPIYWPLSTASGTYTIWLYYHRLTDQTLYTVVNKYLDHRKIDEVNRELTKVTEELANSSGADATRLRDQQREMQQFLEELQDMKAELLRVAGLPYRPNLNDGVIVNAAPLHRLFPHREWGGACEECCNSLENGEFDWSHMAMNLRPTEVRGKCRTDLSLAIAHGLQSNCEKQSAPATKRTRKKKS